MQSGCDMAGMLTYVKFEKESGKYNAQEIACKRRSVMNSATQKR